MEEIALLIKRLKSGKACGLDHIRNEMLKSCSLDLLSIIVSLFNIVFLWNKLISSGVNGKFIKLLVIIHNMYKSAKSCLKVDDKISEYFNCNVGVQ